MTQNNTHTAEVISLDAERQKRRADSAVPVDAGRIAPKFYYKNKPYGADVASMADIIILLQGVRGEVEKKEDAKADALSARAREAKTVEEEIAIGEEAESATETTKGYMSHDYTRLLSFFTELTGQNSLFPGEHGRRIFKLDKEATAELVRLNKPEQRTEARAPVGDNKPNVDVNECFVISREKSEELKTILKNFGGERFKIIPGTEHEDSFIVYMDGFQVPFLCPHEKDYSVKQEEPMAEAEERGEDAKVIPFDRAQKERGNAVVAKDNAVPEKKAANG